MLIHELFEDLTIPQLQQNVQRGFPNTKKRQHDTGSVRVDRFKYTPFKANKLLKIEALTVSTNSNKHNTVVELRNVVFENGDSPDNVTIISGDGQQTSFQPIPLNITNVGVSCNCADYIMRFAPFNLNNNCHIGTIPPRYIRKTTTRPEVNPQHVPGMCKHLLRMVECIRGDGLIV